MNILFQRNSSVQRRRRLRYERVHNVPSVITMLRTPPLCHNSPLLELQRNLYPVIFPARS